MQPVVTRRWFLKGVGLLSASAALAACSSASSSDAAASSSAPANASPLLAIIHTNDTHGHAVEVKGSKDAAGNFSMAAVAALKADWQKKGYDVLVVDAGDATQGMPLVATVKGSSAIDIMNACSYDLMAVGNHEFDWGADALAANEKAAHFPFLAANILDKQTGKLRFAAIEWLLVPDALTTAPTLVYKKDGQVVTPDNTKAGTYDIVPSGANAGSNYSISYASGMLTISEKPMAVPATVNANNRTYDGTEKPLVNVVGQATGGTMVYSLGKDATRAPEGDWDKSIPKAAVAGTYHVWYKVVGDATHNDTKPACVTVTIAPKPADAIVQGAGWEASWSNDGSQSPHLALSFFHPCEVL